MNLVIYLQGKMRHPQANHFLLQIPDENHKRTLIIAIITISGWGSNHQLLTQSMPRKNSSSFI